MKTIQEMYNACQLRHKNNGYEAIVPSSLFPSIFDYGRGFLAIRLSIAPRGQDLWAAHCSISTIDDGPGSIEGKVTTKGAALVHLATLTEYIAKGIQHMRLPDFEKDQSELIAMGFYFYR